MVLFDTMSLSKITGAQGAKVPSAFQDAKELMLPAPQGPEKPRAVVHHKLVPAVATRLSNLLDRLNMKVELASLACERTLTALMALHTPLMQYEF